MPDLLEDDLRAIAPQPRAEFVDRLERRVEGGFAGPPRPARRRSWLWSAAAPVAATLFVVVGISGAIVASNGGSDDESASSGGAGAVSESTATQVAPPAGDASGSLAPGAEVRRVERETAIELATGADEFAETTAGVLRVAGATGTIVQRSNVTEQDGRGFATYDLRVPTSRLDEALRRLSELGDVVRRTASEQDVTASYVSARDRLQDARDERRALLRNLERAGSEAERRAIRRRLAEARARIARAESQVERVRARTDRASVAVTVRSTGESGAWTPGDAFDDALRILEVVAGIALVAAAVLAPVLLLAGAAVGAARLTRRRRRNAILG